MNLNLTLIFCVPVGRCARLFALVAGFACAFNGPLARAADAGALTGSVSNTATGNLLEGARILVPALGLNALTDNSGRFVLSGVPAGTHDVVVSYIGLDSVRAQVTVSPGQRAVRDFDLTTGIYKLDAFKVTGEREGGAAAITAQRNAPNHTNVVAMDSFGNQPNRPFEYFKASARYVAQGSLAYRFRVKNRNVSAQLNVNNLFDHAEPVFTGTATRPATAATATTSATASQVLRSGFYYLEPRKFALTLSVEL